MGDKRLMMKMTLMIKIDEVDDLYDGDEGETKEGWHHVRCR